MFSAISGMKNHQVRMDVIGHNIANVNTVGFKAGRATFQDVLSQTLRGASSPQSTRGGTNPIQVGLGMTLMAVDTVFGQGSLQSTGRSTDLAIQGEGFFVLRAGQDRAYSRAGAFTTDAEGYLVDSGGRRVQGWMATAGQFASTDPASLTDLRIRLGETAPARATTTALWQGNLDAGADIGATRTTTVSVYDSLGQLVSLTVNFTKLAPGSWQWEVNAPPGVPVVADGGGVGELEFDTGGQLAGVTGTPLRLTPPGADELAVTMDFGAMTQCAGPSSAEVFYRDGHAQGELESFAVDGNGTVTAFFTNGVNAQVARMAMATFSNQAGLLRAGENTYRSSFNSGLPQIGGAGEGGRGVVNSGYLELSNVDLALEFTEMIVTQRGFQANSRVISASDEMLHELVNLKR
jgi:flagellar hook protein FlgE